MAGIWLVRRARSTLSGICYGQSNVPVTLSPVNRHALSPNSRKRRESTPRNSGLRPGFGLEPSRRSWRVIV